MSMPDESKISESRSVESTERGRFQHLRLEVQARNVHGLSHESSDTTEAQSGEKPDDPANCRAIR